MNAKRRNREREILKDFIKIAKKHKFDPILGQSKKNWIKLGDNLYFQFGDLRVVTPTYNVVIEVETAGGVTNLVKYWYLLKEKYIESKQIVLLHIFNTNSKNDYGSHMKLWDYLRSLMEEDLGNRIHAKLFKIGFVDQLHDALEHFENTILEKCSDVLKDD